MTQTGAAGLVLILANVIFSYQGIYNPAFFDKYKFEITPIIVGKDYKRMLTSGFLHVGWWHLLFNMISLYAFSGLVESELGLPQFLAVYFVALIGGNLLALYAHRHHGNYSAAGASGAVSGLVFATLALFPGISLGFPFLPVSIPGWLFGIGYVIYTIYGIQSKRDNIGHEAHLGGALAGMLTALLFEPAALFENYLVILGITLPAAVFLYIFIARPDFLFIKRSVAGKSRKYQTIEDRYNEAKVAKEQEVDRILEKVFRRGVESLTKKEKQLLDEHSKKIK